MKIFANLKHSLGQVRDYSIWRAWAVESGQDIDPELTRQIVQSLLQRVAGEGWGRFGRAHKTALQRGVSVLEQAIAAAIASESFRGIQELVRQNLESELPENQRQRLRQPLRDATDLITELCIDLAVGNVVRSRSHQRRVGSARRNSKNKAGEPPLPRFIKKIVASGREPSDPSGGRLGLPLPAASQSGEVTSARPTSPDFASNIRDHAPPWANLAQEAYWLAQIVQRMGWVFPPFFDRLLPRVSKDSELTIEQVRWLLRRSGIGVLKAAELGVNISGLSRPLAERLMEAADKHGWDDIRLARYRRWPFSVTDREETAARIPVPSAPITGAYERVYFALIVVGQMGWPLPDVLTRLLPRHWTAHHFEVSDLADLTSGSGMSVLHFMQCDVRVRGISTSAMSAFFGEFPGGAAPVRHAFDRSMDDLDENDFTIICEFLPRSLLVLEQHDRFEGPRITLEDFLSVAELVVDGTIEPRPRPKPRDGGNTQRDAHSTEDIANVSAPEMQPTTAPSPKATDGSGAQAVVPKGPRSDEPKTSSGSLKRSEQRATSGLMTANGTMALGDVRDTRQSRGGNIEVHKTEGDEPAGEPQGMSRPEPQSLSALVGDATFASGRRYRREGPQ